MPNDSRRKPRIPRYALALLEALRFSTPSAELLLQLTQSEWEDLLNLCDRSQLTLLVGHLHSDALPPWVRVRIDKNLADNEARFERLKSAVFEISRSLTARSIDFALLKGFTHSPEFSPDARLRAQADIDIWCSPDQIWKAQEALVSLGYRTMGTSKGRHLDPMVRETSWEWRGDYFAPDLPIPVDLHYQLWDEEMERISGFHERDVWTRRSSVFTGGQHLPTLDIADTVAFAAFHLLMHLLHGDVRVQRAWEIGFFLNTHCEDDEFWERWQSLYEPSVRDLQTLIFCLVHRWFDSALPALIAEEAGKLPDTVILWIEHFAWSPIESLFAPNKDELWLNLCLLKSRRDRIRVFSRRLIPLRAAELGDGLQSGDSSQAGRKQRIEFLVNRAVHHIQTLVPTLVRGIRWWGLRQGLRRDFLIFLVASGLFDFGEFVFFLLYNLYLLDRGYDERFVGQIASAMTAGTFVGVLPAAAVTRRLGLKATVIVAIAGTVCATALRALAGRQFELVVSAFLNGLFMSFWAVSMPAAVAGFTNKRNRPLGFSLITSIGIGIGALAGFIGGRLPGGLAHLTPALSPVSSKRLALLIGSAIAGVAAIPAACIRFPAPAPLKQAGKIYPQGRFIYSFLAALFVWTLGTGAFNPFFNVYFSRHLHAGTEQIGMIVSYSQLAQVGAILAAPLVIKKIGDVPSVVAMQVVTAGALAMLAVTANSTVAAALYIAYMSFQYMSEPCLLSMLMTRVPASAQSGASALNFLVTSFAGIVAASIAGAMLSKTGFTPTLVLCALVALVSAAIFFFSLRRS